VNWYFVRHGEIASNKKKIYSGRSSEKLTQVGQKQAQKVSSELTGLEIDAIFSSPLKRTLQTSEIIRNELYGDIPIYYDNNFNEIKMGPWEGLSEQKIAEEDPDHWAIWNSSPADLVLRGRETLQQLQSRVIDGLQNIERNNAYNSVLIVTHVAVIRVTTIFASGNDLNTYKSIMVDNAQVFKFENNLSFL